MSSLPNDIETRLRDEIARRGMVLLELKRRGERGTTVVEVIVDSESGVGLDELAELSRWTSALFDEFEDALPGRYRLEVSSAGLDRPLEYGWQYRKNIGRLVKLTLDEEAGRTTELYELAGLDGETLKLVPARKGKGAREPFDLPLDRVVRAVVEPRI